MVNVTLSLHDATWRRMKSHGEIRWSRAIEGVIEAKLDAFDEAERLVKDSRFTEKDARFFADKVDAALARRAEGLLHETRR